jgi:GTP-binding protein LepA
LRPVPLEPAEYETLKAALEKLQLNDAAFWYEAETSQALGFGFRAGFLGLLHMEIIQERLEREFEARLITTAPSVAYKVTTTSGEELLIDNPSKLPDPQKIATLPSPTRAWRSTCPTSTWAACSKWARRSAASRRTCAT